LVKTNREQSLIVHALFGKWNLPGRLSARHGQAWAAASSRTATPEQVLRAFADPSRSQRRIAAHPGVVMAITSGLNSSEYWCLTKRLLRLRKDNRR
jgi:hypothetical protein